MTWLKLLEILRSMEAANHTSMNEPIEMFDQGVFWALDAFESLTTGDVYFIPAVKTEDTTDGEA